MLGNLYFYTSHCVAKTSKCYSLQFLTSFCLHISGNTSRISEKQSKQVFSYTVGTYTTLVSITKHLVSTRCGFLNF
jgi:hypothetical protein